MRLGTAAIGVAALVASLASNVERAERATSPHASDLGTIVSNWFSFFTIQSNIAAALILAIGGALLLAGVRSRRADPSWFAALLACVSTYLIVTGVVYNALLRAIPVPAAEQVPWANEVLHVVVPIVMALDVIAAPGRRTLPWRTVWVVLIYPLAWCVYTFVRGPLIVDPGSGRLGWYPYPFLDVTDAAAWPSALGYVAGIAISILAVAALVVWVGRLRGRRT